MHHTTATHKATRTARHWAQDTLEDAEDAVQTTRKLANASLDKAESRVRRLRQEIEPGMNDLAQRAQELATRGIQYCAETTDRARRRIGHAADATGRYVAEQPVKSLLLAAVAGAALATAAGYAARARKR